MTRILNTTPGQMEDLALAGSGFVETFKRGAPAVQYILKGQNLSVPTADNLAYILAPAADGAIAATVNRTYRQSGFMAPGTKQLLNSHPLRGDFGGVKSWRLRKFIETAPSAFGHVQAIRGTRANFEAHQNDWLPRTRAITGLSIGQAGSRPNFSFDRNGALQAGGAQVLGDGISKAAAVVLKAAPGAMKPLLSIHT